MIVGIEAASTDVSVALADAGGTVLAEATWTSERRQSAELLPRLLALLDADGRTLGDLTAIAVGIGPGSFTGLRVSVALAKGLALALERPIVGVPSLRAWLAADPSVDAAVARAGAHEAIVLRRDDDEPLIAGAEDVGREFGAARVAASAELAAAFGLNAAVPPAGGRAVVSEAARRLAEEPAGDTLATLDPMYLRPPRGVADDPHAVSPWR